MARAPSRGGAELFRAIERDATLSTRVAQQLEGLIDGQDLAPGDRLMSERELAQRFGVSRTVIREAVRALSAKGLLDVRTGDGTYVQQHDGASATEALGRLLRLAGVPSPARAHAVYEVRRPLEIAIAGIAALRGTSADVAALGTWVEAAQAPDLVEARYVEADLGFHLALAAATHNQLFPAILNSVSDLMTAIRELGVAVGGSRREGCQHHQRILERVAAHDVAGAEQAMSVHMDASEQILVRAIRIHT